MNGAVYAVVPAAGAGKRMGSATPKQYLEIAGRSVLEHTLWRLAGQALIRKVVVAISAGDEYFAALRPRLPAKASAVLGGVERCHSVLAALHALALIATTTLPIKACPARRHRVCSRTLRPAISRYCLGVAAPMRLPAPAAGTTA